MTWDLGVRPSILSIEPTLQIQQKLLPPQAAAIAAKLAAFVYHAVAGDDDADAVLAVGMAHGALGAGAADFAGEVFIGTGLAVGNSQQTLPYFLLKRRARIDKRNAKLRQLAGEVLLELIL